MALSLAVPGPVSEKDGVLQSIFNDAIEMRRAEPILTGYVERVFLRSSSLTTIIGRVLAVKLGEEIIAKREFEELFSECLANESSFEPWVLEDLKAVRREDPACKSYLEALVNFKGFQALQCHRLNHWLWNNGRRHLAKCMSSQISNIFNIDIHPAATIGQGVVIDHGCGVVIGETSVVADHVTVLQDVTLGGTGKESGDRHPKIGYGTKIWAGARILGNIRIGDHVQVGASSVVLKDVPSNCTVVGVPARIVRKKCKNHGSNCKAVKRFSIEKNP